MDIDALGALKFLAFVPVRRKNTQRILEKVQIHIKEFTCSVKSNRPNSKGRFEDLKVQFRILSYILIFYFQSCV